MPKRDEHIKKVILKNGEVRYKYNTYVGSVAVPGSKKKKRVFKNGTYKTYNEAKAAYDRDIAKGAGKYKAKKKTVDEVYNEWFKIYKNDVSGATALTAEISYDLHIKPFFGSVYIDKIDVDLCQQWVNDLPDKLVAFKRPIGVFKRIYKFGIVKRYCTPNDNPMEYVIVPKKTRRQHRDVKSNFYTRQELKEFLAAAKKYKYQAYIFFSLIASTGLRRGEAQALEWSDIDLDNGIISITKTRSVDDNGHAITKHSTKNETSTREVVLSDTMIDKLKDYKRCSLSTTTNIVFHRQNNYLAVSSVQYWLKKIYEQNPKLKKITTHGLRHTFATLMRSKDDVKDVDVQFTMGHSSLSMTDHYTHRTQDEIQRLKNALNDIDL